MAGLVEPIARPSSTPGKAHRSFSDPPSNGPNGPLAPSPTFRERLGSRDDHAIPTTPRPIRRPDLLSRGLTLQLPPPRVTEAVPANTPFAVPLSPKQVDSHTTFMQTPSLSHSPATSLPRHSRGLDFSRASTNLHHSTIPVQSSPGSSPIITQKAVPIPGRRLSVNSMALDSPVLNGHSAPWSAFNPDRGQMSSSMGSVNMLGSGSDESSDSDEDASMGGDDNEDPMFTTPQVHKLQNPHAAATPFNPQATPTAAASTVWGSGAHFSPAQTSLMKTMRRSSRVHKTGRRSRKSSSSASGSGYSSVASPRNVSPPPMRSIESAANGGYFSWTNAARSRRESLAMGTDGLHLSSGNDSGDEAAPTAPSTPGVIRRVVTRRQNLLPKTKGFARIRAALAEEAAPVDSEVRREAETIRQVRERDSSVGPFDLEPPQSITAQSSPNLLPAVPESAQEDFGLELDGDAGPKAVPPGTNFAAHASRNSGGLDYWNRFDPSMRTPPPNGTPGFLRQSSSIMSDGTMDSPMGDFTQWRRPRARSSASDASEAFVPSAATPMPAGVNDDMHLKKFKRRREDDFDIATIKRRAVSPGMSAQNSPILTNSPSQRDSTGWGMPPERKDRTGTPSMSDGPMPSSQPHQQTRPGSSLSMPSGSGSLVSQGKKLGLQPMADTNDGLMKMSIE
ncbi:unnamed protein product [Zymoseptoria tritici ST99CH_3D7]|uniref:Uncharacterized protein n=1 Tax=Zymoseptoria tritici (strain ST99CH_3D7) TaxID=1276538 RepID=A0A1X7RRR0_ZYMT9|nr:unnamed protein product [Zymoseptoria tritici ST99CH_3D7]